MLQGAGSNAYSWWCASHIRTNQSKWLDNNLQEMEDMVQSMLKIIKEDADSFAKRAEMYYKRRPELISFVKETYRAYRALAERYDRISGELHKANHSLATAFPDVQFPMQDEDDDSSPREINPTDSIEVPSPQPPEFPQMSLLNKRSENRPATDEGIEKLKSKLQPKKVTSHINEGEANEAVDRLQKSILVLQTEKEFVKSSYGSGVSKFCEIEKRIIEMQEKLGFLQDEFSIGSVIEDDEARATLMAVAAIKSCKSTLFNLQEHQRRSIEETRIESKRLKYAKEKLKSPKGECGQSESEISDENTGTSSSVSDLQQESLDLQSICEKVKDHFEINSDTSVMELAEKIDKLVNRVIGLELTVSSQTAQINCLRTETAHFQKHLSSLDEEKASLADDSNSMSERLEQTVEKLHKIQNLEKHVVQEKRVLCTSFTEACHSLSHISEELQSFEQKNHVEDADPSEEKNISNPRMESQEKIEEIEISNIQDIRVKVEEDMLHPEDEEIQMQLVTVPHLDSDSRKSQILEKEDEVRERSSPQTSDSNSLSHDPEAQSGEPEDAPHMKQLLLNGLEGGENILLDEYTSILQNFKETKRKFLEVEKKNHEYFSETMTQVMELKDASAVKDDEIRSLLVILGSLQANSKLQDSNTSDSNPNLEATNKKDVSFGIQCGGSLHANEDIKTSHTDEAQTILPIEENFRKAIDTLLDGNLEFWFRFSTLFHEIQRFGTEFQNLQAEVEKLKDSKAQEGNNSSAQQAGKTESAPIDKQLRELKTALQVWTEQNALLTGELQSRFSSFCSIQDEISRVLKASAEADFVQFTPFQAATLQGEVLNMKRENDKVVDELQAGLDHVKGLQADVEKALSNLLKLHEKLELATSKSGHHHYFRHFSSKSRGVSLQAFLYGVKPKKPSIFSCMNPALQKQYSDLGAGNPI